MVIIILRDSGSLSWALFTTAVKRWRHTVHHVPVNPTVLKQFVNDFSFKRCTAHMCIRNKMTEDEIKMCFCCGSDQMFTHTHTQTQQITYHELSGHCFPLQHWTRFYAESYEPCSMVMWHDANYSLCSSCFTLVCKIFCEIVALSFLCTFFMQTKFKC